MTIYELIQELANYAPNATVTFVAGGMETEDCSVTVKQHGSFPDEVRVIL